MNKNDLFKAIGGLDEETLDVKSPPRKSYFWAGGVAAVLVLALGLNLFLKPQKESASVSQPVQQAVPAVRLLAEPRYPEMVPYPADTTSMEDYDAWFQSIRSQQRDPAYKDGLEPFFSSVIRTFLKEENGENKVCSPVNIYMALSMLSETAGGDSRQEILDALGVPDLDTLRRQADDLWNAQYLNDQATFLILSNSLWLNQNLSLQQDTLNRLAETYYASAYSGIPGTEEMDQALRTWLNDQTGGLLQNQLQNVSLDPATVLALASTIHYQAKWGEAFYSSDTSPETFHSPGGDVAADFLHAERQGQYYWAEHFSAICLPMTTQAGSMWLILPHEGTSPEMLSRDPALFRFLADPYSWEQQKYLSVHMQVPKFDISSDLDLTSGLQAMGIHQVFGDSADFSPLADPASSPDLKPKLTQCSHAVRLSLDEEGISASAYVQMAMAGTGAPPFEEIDFILDRPFLFVLQSRDELPLFAGIVNNPIE